MTSAAVLSHREFDIGSVKFKIHMCELKHDDRESEFLFAGSEIASVVGYKKPCNAISDHVIPKWRRTWEHIKGAVPAGTLTSSGEAQLRHNWQPNTVFITVAGVYALITRSKLPLAIKFQEWLFEDVLPEMRRTGQYVKTQEIVRRDEQIRQKDERIEGLTMKLHESNNSLRVANEHLIEFAKEMIIARSDAMKMANRMADIAQDVIAKPANAQLLHSLAVCDVGNNEYAFLRPQKRSMKRSLKRLSVDESNIIFKSDYVPNAMNVLNKVKEHIPRSKYTAKSNKIKLLDGLDRESLVSAINATMTERQVAIFRNKAVSSPKRQ